MDSIEVTLIDYSLDRNHPDAGGRQVQLNPETGELTDVSFPSIEGADLYLTRAEYEQEYEGMPGKFGIILDENDYRDEPEKLRTLAEDMENRFLCARPIAPHDLEWNKENIQD